MQKVERSYVYADPLLTGLFRSCSNPMENNHNENANQYRLEELALPNPLRQYQWQGVHFLVDRDSALLADGMGLGKTVQVAVALSILFRNSHVNRALVVVPASLRLNWERELRRWAPSLSIQRVQGDAADRLAFYRLPINVLVASYDQIRLDSLAISKEVVFDVVVLDEAQRIKNSSSKTALACRTLQRKRSWALTGTPLENNVNDLISDSTAETR